jgi:hypothetical protein
MNVYLDVLGAIVSWNVAAVAYTVASRSEFSPGRHVAHPKPAAYFPYRFICVTHNLYQY